MSVEDFIGCKVIYDDKGQLIWGENEQGGLQLILDVRGWGGIQNKFKDKDGVVDLVRAADFQDELGKWVAEAINQKLKSNK